MENSTNNMTFIFNLVNSLMSFFGALGDVMSDVINSYNLMTPEENQFEISQIWRVNQTNKTHNHQCDKIQTLEKAVRKSQEIVNICVAPSLR